jgi:hypothetical protein
VKSMQSALRTGLATVLMLVSVCASQPSWAADVKITDEARKHFAAGVALLKDPDGARYEEAYGEFKVAYQASPSWKILGNLGLAAMKLERDGEAIEAFARYLDEGKKEIDAAERADMERDLTTLRASAVTVTVTTKPAQVFVTDERVPVQGSPVRNRYQSQDGSLRLQIRPGHHVMTASVDGKSPQRLEFDAEPGSTRSLAFDFETPAAAPPAAIPAPSPRPAAPAPAPRAAERPVPTSVWVGTAVTSSFTLGAAIVGVLALGKNSDYETANGVDAARAKSLRDETGTLNLVTDVLIGAAVVSAGVTTYLYLKRPERDAALQLRVGPQIGLNQGGLKLEGAF